MKFSKQDAILTAKKFGPMVVIALITAFYCYNYIDPITRTDSHKYRMWMAISATLLAFARFHKAPLLRIANQFYRQAAFNVYSGLLVIAFVAGIFNYYQFDRKVVEGLDDYTDIAYYYLNSKYLEELGYTKFYAAMLYADLHHKNRHASKIRRYRDLRDYDVKSTRVAFEHGKEIKDTRFTEERWRSFTEDIDWFMARKTTANLQGNFFVDHGYNPPPTWAVFGGILAKTFPVDSVKLIALVDLIFIVAMLVAVAWTFGFESMLFVGIFFLCSFSGRWPVLTHSLLRFDWSAALVIAFCAFKKERWISAGALLSYAALTRIFPAVFFFAWGVVAAREIWESRSIPRHHLKFAAGAAAMALVLVVSAMAMYGPAIFKESAENLIMHNESYSSHRVGLGDLIVYDGETTREEVNSNGGIAGKEIRIQEMQTTLRLVGMLMIALLALYIWRLRKKVTDVFHLAIIPFYCVTNPQINYWYVRLPLVLWHAVNIQKPVHKLGLALIFIVEIVTQYVFLQAVPRYTVTSVTSIAMAVYFGLMLFAMTVEFVQQTLFKPKADAPLEAVNQNNDDDAEAEDGDDDDEDDTEPTEDSAEDGDETPATDTDK
ncbi:MAG: hypothetical protein JXX29_20010 [Deltaproteobacteria bacterium]|nr:hypothetical protein [Deltaproteobacteria bacterium]MBN2673977.1 hypothetical protein [Deltaproteobacteria bacterium]